MRIDPQIRSFLAKINKDSKPFWELPQPKPQEILTGLQSQATVDISGVTKIEKTIFQDGRTVKLYIMKPENVTGTPGILLFIHGGVGLSAISRTTTLRDLCRGLRQIGVFVEYTPLPAADSLPNGRVLAVLKWVAEHAGEFGADGTPDSDCRQLVGGNMTAALSLAPKGCRAPKSATKCPHSGDRRQRRPRPITIWSGRFPAFSK
jgi:acetyl esterase/lipase